MFKRILVPLDGSDLAERAMPVAARLAKASGGTVIVLQVVAIPVETGKVVIYNQQAIDNNLGVALDYLERVAQSEALSQCAVEIHSLAGATAPTLLSAIPSFQVDIVVMCSHGYTTLKRWALGSVSQKVARHSPVPVLILPEGTILSFERQPAREHSMTAIVALDGSSLSEAALEPAVEMLTTLAASGKTVLHLVEVVSLPVTYGHLRSQTLLDAETVVQEKQEAETYLTDVKKKLSQKLTACNNLTIATSVVVDADIAEAIMRVAGNKHEQNREQQTLPAADFIAMATHGRGGLPRWIMGSITERVLHAASLPLMIVSPWARETRHTTNGASIFSEKLAMDEVCEIGQD
ncbi:MAG TPA: universal stress protein [Ktedonobacteraceae bacterium]|nr:universal stress protein [Ktedonobacteraceae bacterium]